MNRWPAVLAATAVLFVAAPIGTVATAAPATCTGVWVVVDATALGGEVATSCATEFPNGTAALTSAGHSTDRASTMLCQIDATPTRCEVSAAAYWSYWQAAPEGDHYGAWVYATVGPDGYHPIAGNAEGWVFGDGHTPPATLPSTLAIPGSASPASEPPADPRPASEPAGDGGGPIGLAVVAAVAVVAGLGVWLARRRAR